MITISNLNFIYALLAILGVIFAIYRYFRDPQVSSEKNDALLAQQVGWNVQSSEKRFEEMQKNFQNLLLQSNNHIHTVDTKVETLSANVGQLSRDIVKLSTIVEERLPKKV